MEIDDKLITSLLENIKANSAELYQKIANTPIADGDNFKLNPDSKLSMFPPMDDLYANWSFQLNKDKEEIKREFKISFTNEDIAVMLQLALQPNLDKYGLGIKSFTFNISNDGPLAFDGLVVTCVQKPTV